MKWAINLALIIVAAALGLAIGFVFRAKAKPSAASQIVEQTHSKNSAWLRSSERGSPVVVAPIDDSPLATKLERDLSMSAGVTRWLYWLEAMERATPQDFPRLMRLAQNNSNARRFIAARWVELHPRHMFETLVAALKNSDSGLPVNELASMLFEEWPKRDPDGAIAALTDAREFGNRNWRMQVANSIFNSDVERGLRLMNDWQVDYFIPRMTAVTKWAEADPRHAAQFTLDHPCGAVSREMIQTIGREWVKTDPAAAMEFARETSGELGSTLASSALKEWAARDLKQAADWLATTDARTRGRLGSAFVESWAKDDPASALEWCALNLSGSSLAKAVGGVLTGAAQKDLAAAQALVASMNPSAARAEAAAAVAQKAISDSMSQKPVAPETIAWFKQLDSLSLKRALDQMSWRWVATDPNSLAELLASQGNGQVSDYIYDAVARRLARKNPLDALEWSAQLPSELALSTGKQVFEEWKVSQPEAALNWLDSLPKTDPRREPLVENLVNVLAHYSKPDDFAFYTPAERAAARRVVESMPAADARRAKLLALLKAP